MTAITIREKDLAIVQAILQTMLKKEAKVWVFGSRAKGTTKRAADLDLAIDAGRPLLPNEVFELTDAFEESDLPYRVDIVDLWTVNPTFRGIIDEVKVPLPFQALFE